MVAPLDRSEPRSRHVSDIAVESHLYTALVDQVGETVAIERLLAQADGKAAAAIDRLRYRLLFPPGPAARADIAIWIALLAVRDPFSRRQMEAMADQMYKLDLSLGRSAEYARARLRGNLGREPTDEEVADIVELATDVDDIEVVPHQSNLVKLMLDNALAMFPFLIQRRYTVFAFNEPGLVLSDRPLVLYQTPANRNPLLGVGIVNADQLWLPLDRRTALVLHSDPAIPEEVRFPADPALIDTFNGYVVRNAWAEVYCHPDDLRRLDGYEFPPPNRPIMEVNAGLELSVRSDGVNAAPERRRHRRYRRGSAS